MAQKHFNYKIIFIGLFMLMITLPLLLTIWENAGGKKFDVALEDNSGTTYELPHFEIQTFIDGKFQNELENYWNNNFVLHGVFTKSYNQIRFSAFRLNNSAKDGNFTGDDIIVGKHKNIFGYSYIFEYNYRYVDANLIKNYVRDLEDVSNKLNAVEKKLIVMTTPSKCDYMNDDVPNKFAVATQENRAIDIFHELIKNTSISYVDTRKVIEESGMEYPVFYRSGVHWSRTAEQYANIHVLDMIKDSLGVPIKSVALKDVQSSNDPYWRDTDVWGLLNIWEKNRETYYQFDESLNIPEDYEDFNVLLQGGSFSEGFRKMLLDNHVSPLVQFISYDKALIDMNYNTTTVINTDWNQLDWQTLLDSTDVLVVELNEAHLSSCSSGFIAYLNKYLDSYISLHH